MSTLLNRRNGGIWKRGQKAAIARLAGISAQNFSDIIHRRRHAQPDKARRLEKASGEILGEGNKIPWVEFLESERSTNPYFIGEILK